MDDKNFDKIFQRKLNDLPGIPASEANWTALSGRLDAHEGRRKKWLVPFLLFLIGLLSGFPIWSGFQMYQSGQFNARSTEQLTIKRDTIIQTTTIYRYDTVYIRNTPTYSTFSLRNTISGTGTAVSQNTTVYSDKTTTSLPNTGMDVAQNTKALPSDKTSTSSPTNSEKVTQIPTTNSDKTTTSTPTNGADVAQNSTTNSDKTSTSTPTTNANAAENTTENSEKIPEPVPGADSLQRITVKVKRAPRIFLQRPQLGLSFGRSTPVLAGLESGAILQTGLVGNIEVMRGLRLEAGVQYQQAKMKSEETSALENLVTIPNPGSNYSLDYWETYKLPMLTYSAHLRYQIGSWFQFSPYIGIGGRVKTVLPFEIEYEFEDDINQLELNEPGATRATTSWQGFTHTVGIERNTAKNYTLALEGIWLKNWGGPADIFNEHWGINARIMYRF